MCEKVREQQVLEKKILSKRGDFYRQGGKISDQIKIKRLEGEVEFLKGVVKHLRDQLKLKQDEIDFANELHFDECVQFANEVSDLKQKLKQKSLN